LEGPNWLERATNENGPQGVGASSMTRSAPLFHTAGGLEEWEYVNVNR